MPLFELDQGINVVKWRGIFVGALRKVQLQVHPSLTVADDALNYIETLIIQLLDNLCVCQPHSSNDVEERIKKTFPHPIDKWAIGDAQAAVEKGKKKSPLVLPVDKVHPLLQKEILGYKVDYQVSLYIAAVLEYISADILKLAGNYVKNIRHNEITSQDIKVAICADKVLMDMFQHDDVTTTIQNEDQSPQGEQTFDEVLKDFLASEAQYIRDLSMIIKVFQVPVMEAKSLFSESDIYKIFANIQEVYDFSLTLMSLLDAAVETATEEGTGVPAIGACFEDMAEAAAFDIYETYALELTAPGSKLYRHLGIGGKLYEVMANPDVTAYFKSRGSGFVEAVKYVLPKLLLVPIYHFLQYFDVMKALQRTSPDEDDKESIDQACSVLQGLQTTLERCIIPGNASISAKRKPHDRNIKLHRRRVGATRDSIAKMNELQKNIDGWEGKNISQCCTELIREGVLLKVQSTKKTKERCVFLFDGLLICCRQNSRHSITNPTQEYRLKEKFFLRKVEILDLDDTPDVKNAFEIVDRDQGRVTMACKSEEEKNEWMALLMTLYMRSTLDRLLDQILLNEERAIPLRLPDPSIYPFAVEDAEDNIVFEEVQENSTGVPVIKGGTLTKLIERLTYHKYADPTFVRIFLTTYRSFCKPRELLLLLIKRYEIPEPEPTEQDRLAMERGEPVVREDLKRFRKEYQNPIQLRVLNVMRHWVDHHFYDFERDTTMLTKLQQFLENVKGKAMQKWVFSINKVIERKRETEDVTLEITFEKDPPPVEWHLTRDFDKFDILTLHPIEIARQLTLMEFKLYRAIQPSELVGSVWTKEDSKYLTSPNLLKMIHHSNKVTLWLEKSLLEMANFEERSSILTRIVDILMVFQELNNFNGILEIVSALNSSPVFRLHNTFADLPVKRQQSLEEAKELSGDHYKRYIEKLRSINPPCVPFLGMYLTNILKIEEGNPDFLPNYPEGIINFNKRRKVADITGEIQQYQNQPYCLETEPLIKRFFEELDPSEGRTGKEMEDYLYKLSLDIEPRNCEKLPKFPRKTDLPLKSPGVKPSTPKMTLSVSSSLGHRKGSLSSIDSADISSPLSPQRSSTLSLGGLDTMMDQASKGATSNFYCPIPDSPSEPSPLKVGSPGALALQEDLPSDLPPVPPRMQRKGRATSMYETSSKPMEFGINPVRRQQSLKDNLHMLHNAEAAPAIPPRPPKHQSNSPHTAKRLSMPTLNEDMNNDSGACNDPPPLPPRESSVSTSPPPLPPRTPTHPTTRSPVKKVDDHMTSNGSVTLPPLPPDLPPKTQKPNSTLPR